MFSPVDLHLVSWNRYPMTELVIKTIHRNTKADNFRLIVLDNGSSGETPDKLNQLHEAGLIDEYIPLKTNIGLEAARNFMLRNCTLSDYFVDIDNDCLAPPPVDGYDWIEQLVDLMQKYEDYAALACRTQIMIGTGNIFEDADKNDDDILEFPHPGGSFRIMNSDAVYRVGGWDREEAGRGSEERYICGKLREAGWKTGFAVKIPTLHLFGLNNTDSWGYPKDWKPQDTGHSPDVWHPKFEEGDVMVEIAAYSGKDLAYAYCNNS